MMGKKEPVCLCYIEQAADETIEMMLVVILLPISFPSFLWPFTWNIFVFGQRTQKTPDTMSSQQFWFKSIPRENCL